MQHDTEFSVRYLTDGPVPIRDIIESLRGIETLLQEASRFLPSVVDGLEVQRIELKVREIAQESPLRELICASIFFGFQAQLEDEVPNLITDATGFVVPDRFDTVVTVLALILVFYGAGAIKDLVFGSGPDGAAEKQLKGLIEELAFETGKSPKNIKDALEKRYGDKVLWKRLASATSRFFMPSKRQENAPMEVNNHYFNQETIKDIPAEYLVDHEADNHPARNFPNALLEIHAQDKDHSGRGWAAIVEGISDKRIRLKLMDEVSSSEIWGHDRVRGNITIVYDRIGTEMVPKEVHLHDVTGFL
ncbi:hypothetical protein [Rhizorhapis sp. SPR117]|uniref:hypothetical protein n=1 Tax=Rhizorhapis sp. SPR117 TaxID=2912611 RepID=UPI001F15D435|nr:hypothetical protein [Rhizorhapis sp. SPR117]